MGNKGSTRCVKKQAQRKKDFFYRQKLGKLEAVVKATVQVLGWSCVIFT